MSKLLMTVIVAAILFFSFIAGFTLYQMQYSLNEKTEKLDNINLIVSLDLSDADEYYSDANDYYTSASLSYEQEDWDGVVRNCELSRDRFSLAGQEYRNQRATILDTEQEFIDLYAELLLTQANMAYNLYEACEHFESAARYYKKYYLPETAYDDSSFDMAGGEIDSMNEKITEHDDNVERYNLILADYNHAFEEYLS